jgi:hypothetical protein
MSLPRRQVTVIAAGWLVALGLASCGPANERPLRGAQPGTQAPSPSGAPPTLEPSETLRLRALPSPSADLAASSAAKPSPSVAAAPPIVRTIVPSANAHVAGGSPITLSAVLVGRGADLITASLSINGADAGAQIEKRSARDWTIHASRALTNGTHTVRVLVRDASGAAGGFTWQFLVADAEHTPVPNP